MARIARIVAPGYRPRTTRDIGVPVSYVPAGRRSFVAFVVFHKLLLVWLPALLLRYRPDVVYSRGLFHSFLVHLICRAFRTPYVAEINSIVDEELAIRGAGRCTVGLVYLLDRWNLRWASGFVCVTEGLAAELLRRGTKPERVFVIHNGAAVELFTPGDRREARRQLGLPEEALVIGFVGTLVAWQGLDLLVAAAGRLKSYGRPWQVLIVGDGQMREPLAAQIVHQGLQEHVRLLPAVPHEEVPGLMRALDMMVVPIHDPRKLRYGLSVLKFWEALAVGLPVLVPQEAGLSAVLRELDWPGEFAAGPRGTSSIGAGPQCSSSIGAGDAEALAEAIVRTAGRLDDCRSRAGEIHDVIRREHSWAAVAKRTEEVLERLLRPRT